MSFYFDDDDVDVDDEHDTGANQLSQLSASASSNVPNFICDNCGSTQSYLDEHGGLCCAECFTQSQNIIDSTQQEMEFEDAMDLAARNRGGRLMSAIRRKGVQKERAPLETYDRSIPLPNLELCLRGFQRVLKESCKTCCELLSLSDGQSKVVLSTLKDMMTAYLRAFADSAEHYGAIHPKMRFSLRDSFLSPIMISRILGNLSYKSQEKLKEEVAEKMSNAENPDADDTTMLEAEVNAAQDYMSDDEQVSTAKTGTRRVSRRTGYLQMLKTHFRKSQSVGRMEAALLVQPSMSMLAAMLLLAAAPVGLTDFLLMHWIENGDLPLLNAFSMLPDEEKRQLEPIKSFFRPHHKMISVDIISRAALGMQVACGFENAKDDEAGMRGHKTKSAASRKGDCWGMPDLLKVTTLPIVVSRLVTLCGFSEKVMCYALNLMGLDIPKQILGRTLNIPSELPQALRAASPGASPSKAHIAAVMVVACKLAGWSEFQAQKENKSAESDEDGLQIGSQQEESGNVPDLAQSSRTSAGRSNKIRKIKSGSYVAWNNRQFGHLRNGPRLESYLHFLEQVIFADENEGTSVPEFTRLLFEEGQTESASTSKSVATAATATFLSSQQDSSVASETSHRPSEAVENAVDHSAALSALKTSSSSGKRQYTMSRTYGMYKFNFALRPSCRVTGIMIEIMAYYIREEPSEIELHVKPIEDEILRLCDPKESKTTVPLWKLHNMLLKNQHASHRECMLCLQNGGGRADSCPGRRIRGICKYYFKNGHGKVATALPSAVLSSTSDDGSSSATSNGDISDAGNSSG